MKKYDVEKEQKGIDALLKYSWVDCLCLYVSLGLAYLGYDLKLQKFMEFSACSAFVLFIWILCTFIVIIIHYIIKHKQKNEKVGEEHENK